MKNRDFIKSLGRVSILVTIGFFIYPLVVGLIILQCLVDNEPSINGWIIFSAIPSVYFAWFMSWVTDTLWDTAENSN